MLTHPLTDQASLLKRKVFWILLLWTTYKVPQRSTAWLRQVQYHITDQEWKIFWAIYKEFVYLCCVLFSHFELAAVLKRYIYLKQSKIEKV